MPRYLSLINFTEQGIRTVADSAKRAKVFASAVEKAGGTIDALYWALGEFDGAIILEAPTRRPRQRCYWTLAARETCERARCACSMPTSSAKSSRQQSVDVSGEGRLAAC